MISELFLRGNEYEIMSAVLNDGPVVVGYAVYRDFFYYRSGIYYHLGSLIITIISIIHSFSSFSTSLTPDLGLSWTS